MAIKLTRTVQRIEVYPLADALVQTVAGAIWA